MLGIIMKDKKKHNINDTETVNVYHPGIGNIKIPIFSIYYHFPVLYEHEKCPICNGSGKNKKVKA